MAIMGQHTQNIVFLIGITEPVEWTVSPQSWSADTGNRGGEQIGAPSESDPSTDRSTAQADADRLRE